MGLSLDLETEWGLSREESRKVWQWMKLQNLGSEKTEVSSVLTHDR